MNKRITEHDKAVTEGFAKTDITLQMIHDSEADVEVAKINCEKAREKLAQLKLKLREKEKEGMAEEDLPGIKVNIKELDDVLLRDVGNKIKESGKWPLLIDPSSQAATFLRYRDTNYLNALNPAQMEPEKVRLAVLGSVRYGKSLVLDMMEVDMFDTVSDRFDEVHKGLMNMIMDKSLLKDEAYTCLLRKGDPQEYDKNKFIENRVQNFKFVIITKNPLPPAELLEKTYAIRIHINTM
ncbi:putative IQ motif and ankyrin repeat domain-containing protein [Lingula anatina]|uniref:IQ motif and ankyrin repeat domain-containing protein n=1 Tax=Lingula anatina TaxID=7574 RepID=A0A1S3IG85_LINAN|nr:putative IQ motif and ankyrin repeat domain-containing protein [Lingula anatina]|eukprot:XP_013396876.1 putative IQ motif and ankyrin repeat domain-containing protein [Lingula anatina]